MTRWFRRAFRRPPTLHDCMAAAREAAPVDWVERTRQSRDAHLARYLNDDGWVEPVWGTFAEQHDLGGEA